MIRESKRKLFFTVLNCAYGANAPAIQKAIRTEAQTMANHERTLFQAATILSSRTSSFLQAQQVTREWAGVKTDD